MSKRETSYMLKPTDEIEIFTSEKQYSYDGDRLLSVGNEEVIYGDGVNAKEYRGKALEWKYGKQLVQYGDHTFAYDGYGRRIRKNNTVFVYDVNNKLVKQSDGENELEFVYDNHGISGVRYNGTEYIYSKDIQLNIVGILDNTGKEVVQYKYDVWGNVKTIVIDEAHADIAEKNPYRYRSYYYDEETNLYYLNTRYYDPEIGRFISQDDVAYLDPEHINGLNLYAYCGNNPVMNIDPNGTFALTALLIGLLVGAVAGAVVGGTVAGVVASNNGAKGWELFGWTTLGVLGGAVVGGAIGAGLGAAAGAIFPGLNAALAGSMSLTLPALMNIGGMLAIGSTTILVPAGAIAVVGAVAVGVGVGAGIMVSFFKEHTKNARPSTKGRHQQGEANRKKDQWGEKGDSRRIRYRKNHSLIFLLLDWLFDD